MDLDRFRDSLEPPEGLGDALLALWHERRGDWQAAHTLVEDGATADDCRVHGYLHRVEGDPGNAAYWYRRAGSPVAHGALEAEWTALATGLLNRSR